MILSFDISTSVVGFSVFNKNGTLIELDCVKFRDKQTLFEKIDMFKDKLKHYNGADVTHIIIEEPLKKFAGKFSNATTISILNNFNGMISAYLYLTFGIEPQFINVQTARKTAFPNLKLNSPEIKHEVWKKVVECEPKINWRYSSRTGKLMDENYDMSDSYVVGRAYLRILNDRKDISLVSEYFKD
jgi:hypothetical protein